MKGWYIFIDIIWYFFRPPQCLNGRAVASHAIPGRDRPNFFKHVVTVPLPNARRVQGPQR